MEETENISKKMNMCVSWDEQHNYRKKKLEKIVFVMAAWSGPVQKWRYIFWTGPDKLSSLGTYLHI